MITVEGKHGVKATVICHSVSEAGIQLPTFEIEYPRMVLAELNTHGMLTKNSASSRAIPFAKMKEQLKARPVRFGQANPGMQDKGVDFDGWVVSPQSGQMLQPDTAWNYARNHATQWSEAFYEAGYHKQVYNRLTETFQMMKTVISGTELDNYFWLRDDGAADPTIAELAKCMREALEQSTPTLLKAGEWHLPYVSTYRDADGVLCYSDDLYVHGYLVDRIEYTLKDALKVSAARTAAVSFRNIDYGLGKCREVYDRLVGDVRKHASAFAHQATPMHEEFIDYMYNDCCNDMNRSVNIVDMPSTWEPGVSHMDRDGQLWSAQFRGWIMHRKLIPGENYIKPK